MWVTFRLEELLGVCQDKKSPAKVWITSLNSHFGWSGLWHKMLKRKEAEQRTPHFLSLNQDIVASPQDEKCGLKYVMFT
jgi:hypothetical protein